MIGDMGVRVREEEIVDVVRMRKKDEGGPIRPIIVEFRTEYDNNNNIYLKSDIHKMFNRLYIKTYTNNITEIHV